MDTKRHETANLLIETTEELIKTMPLQDISVDHILLKSGISKGSLYHHFKDLSDLLVATQLHRYSRWVDGSIQLMDKVLTTSKSREDVINGLKDVTIMTQHPKFRFMRYERATALISANQNEDFAKRLSVLQARLTDGIERVIRKAIEQGLFRKELDPRAVAVFIQAYTLGRIIDEIDTPSISAESWNELIGLVLDRALIN